MTSRLIELTEDEFAARYSLLPNHLHPASDWQIGTQVGGLFETYGEEFQFIRQQNPLQVWTLAEYEDGQMFLQSGLHFVNRLAYAVSQRAVPLGIEIEVPLESESEGCSDPE